MTVQLFDLVALCDQLMQPWRFQDYCPNGLQVEGRDRVNKIVTGVTASQALIKVAIAQKADVILVHHGYFWKGDDLRIKGMLRHRLGALLKNDISLLAYHLPLDAQPDFGNNVRLAQVLGLQVTGPMDPGQELSMGLIGRLPTPMTGKEFSNHLQKKLGRTPLHIAGKKKQIETIAWCTGAAQGFIDKASELKVDAYLTGEISEPTTHVARETGIHFFAAGHHATERYGVQALGERLADELNIEHQFIDIDNPA
ncbi:MAG: Nif3-like dinuclear metal center hexameric protein [Pseudomonadales bacterium]|nr:Nif3-like dinuclear metal center hexameric protein [Pseudomonadales bacterium]